MNNVLFKNCLKHVHHSDLFIALFDLYSLSLHYACQTEFTTTERGARMLIRNGFRYAFQKELSNNLQSSECLLRRKGQRKAKIKLYMNGELFGEINEHTHPPS